MSQMPTWIAWALVLGNCACIVLVVVREIRDHKLREALLAVATLLKEGDIVRFYQEAQRAHSRADEAHALASGHTGLIADLAGRVTNVEGRVTGVEGRVADMEGAG